MRSMKMVALVALLAGSVAFGASQVVYTLEIGGNPHADLWEANQSPTFTKGVTAAPWPEITDNGSVTWAVRVTVGGMHAGTPAGEVFGAANLVFDLELYDSQGNLVSVGAAPLVASGNENVPDGPGFWSAINDGDTAGARGAIVADIEANGAFAIDINNQNAASPNYSLIDPAPNGPGFDYGWYPTANGRGGVDIEGTKPINYSINDPALAGKLVGFGAGMKSYDYTSYRPGVGKLYFSTQANDYGFGAYIDDLTPELADPLNPPAGVQEKVLFEGQISTKGLANGTYTLKIKPSADGTNVMHGQVQWQLNTPAYGGYGSFAVKAEEVYPDPTDVANQAGVQFVVNNPVVEEAEIVARNVFYNQSAFDGNKAAIDAAPIAGAKNDDADAIDPSKSPLMLGGGQSTFANWTGYVKGLNGLIYDVKGATQTPVAADFTFSIVGRNGTAAPVAVAPSGFATYVVGDVTRCVVTFANNAVQKTWLQVNIGTGFGLPAAETHFWGSAPGDTGDNTPYTLNKAATTSSSDNDGIRTHPTSPNQALVDNVYDIDKNARVSSTDTDWFLVAGFPTNPGNALLAISK